MNSKENEYKELFLAEAQESYEELNRLFTDLEKDVNSKKAVEAIFRITHTLKGNAMGLGFSDIAVLSHTMEDVFNSIKQGTIFLDEELFNTLYRANDKLGELIYSLKTDKKVLYKGIKTKLEVYLKSALNREQQKPIEQVVLPAEENTDYQEVTEDKGGIQQLTMSDVVQVPVRKLDNLLNIIGELLIEKDSLIAKAIDKGARASEYSRLHRISSDLQYGVMDIRLIQIGFLFNKFHRIVRDVAAIEKKKAELVLEGTEIEIDRNILKIMSDSLIHLVRNSVSHGIETPEERKKAYKPEIGKITLKSRNEKDTVFIEVTDDGKGIDPTIIRKKIVEKKLVTEEFARTLPDDEVIMYIFEPGFSSVEHITEVSGRGVGMDVVKRATESIGGNIKVKSVIGKGTTITLLLPSSMALKPALLFELNKQEYAIALSYTEAVISLYKHEIHKVGNGLMSKYLGNTISILFLSDLFAIHSLNSNFKNADFQNTYHRLDNNKKLEVVIVSYGNKHVGLVVDKLLQQKEIVEKSLSDTVNYTELFSGATILGNGNVCLVLDIAGIINQLFKEKNHQK